MNTSDLTEPVVAVVVAAGSGVRFGGSTPKALVSLAGRPLVRHSVEALVSGGAARVVVVTADDLRPDFEDALRGVGVPVDFVGGGRRRQDSVRAGLEALAGAGVTSAVVLVHDAARPLVPTEVVAGVVAAVAEGAPAVVPAVAVVDSIRSLSPHGGSSVVDRSLLRAVQTPQGFDLTALLAAHRAIATSADELTDDAAVMERAGHAVSLVEGSRDSLKVTEPIDLDLAEAVLARRKLAGQLNKGAR
ncbi:2-C-methyl-D-erythritol 4-phosphate cytidylyltransferase [Aestuariimicrobium soli]|uniref:2-C-methyl-D-erythritol 4-phosphate cytidylyltransferase n=1 Tax=Aestuariimicrobium soli TaxID=2035834 RepID=UPI003EBCFDD3